MIDIVSNCDCYLILMSGCVDCTLLCKIKDKSTKILDAGVVIVV